MASIRFRNRHADGRPAGLAQPGPVLAKYGRDLTRLAITEPPLAGRHDELAQIFEVLLRWRHNNALIVGRPGVGKTALLREVARRLASGQAGDGLGVRAVVELNVRALVAGAGVRGQLEERTAAVVKELLGYRGALIAAFDDLPSLVGSASVGGLDLLSLFAPVLESVQTPCLATAEPELLTRSPELELLLGAHFQLIQLEEPGPSDTIDMIKVSIPQMEEHHRTRITTDAIYHAAHLARRYLRRRALPDSAVSLLDQAAAAAALAGAEMVTAQLVAMVASKQTGVPVQQLLDEEAGRLAHLEEVLHRRVVGQDVAVTAIANAVRRARARLADPLRPVGSFLFLGPTGVGKTELARALAGFLFQDEGAMVRIDMSEYMERHQVARLIGAPPGYVGYGEGGQLTEAVRRRPYGIVLLDELEKAHPDVFNLLLQVMEDGRLTDGRGETVDFRNTVVVMTSNSGSDQIVRMTGAPEEEVRAQVMKDVRQQFKPEFLNRLDEIIVFQRLTREQIREVVDIQIARLQDRLADYRIELSLSDRARDWLATEGYDPEYGARPLRRLIRRELEDPLASMAVSGELLGERGRVLIDTGSEGLTLLREERSHRDAGDKQERHDDLHPEDEDQA